MSASTSVTSTPYRAPEHRLSFGGLLRSEWIKFWSIRSTVIVLAIAAVVTIGIGVLLSALLASSGAEPISPTDADAKLPIGTPLIGLQLAGLLVAAVGAIAMGNEYASGSIRSTLVAAPRRWPVLLAKLVVVAAIVLVVFAVTIAITLGLSGAVLGGAGFSLDFSAPDTAQTLIGHLAVLVGIAWSGLGLAALIRNSAAAICIVIGLLFVLPLLLLPLPDFAGRQLILDYNYAAAASSVTSPAAGPDETFGGPGVVGGSIAFAIWVLAFLGAGALSLVRRDA